MTDFQKILDAVLADAKKRKLTLDDLAKLILTKDHPALKGLDPKMVKDALGHHRGCVISEAQNRMRLESIETEQAYYSDKLDSISEFASFDKDQKAAIAATIIAVKKPEWKATTAEVRP